MKKLIILLSALAVLLTCVLLPLALSKSADAAQVPENFNVNLATTIIVIVSAALTAAIVISTVVLAVRNKNN